MDRYERARRAQAGGTPAAWVGWLDTFMTYLAKAFGFTLGAAIGLKLFLLPVLEKLP